VNRSVSLDVGVRLDETEARNATVAAILGSGEVHGTGPPMNLEAANRGVREVLRHCAHVFKPLFDGEIHFCVDSRAGHAQTVTTHLRFSLPQGDVCLDRMNRLTLTPFGGSSWSGVYIPDEIVSEIRSVRPGSFNQTGSGPPFNPEDGAAIARALDIDWVRRKLVQREDVPLPTAAQLEQIHLAEDRPYPNPNQVDELIGLVTFVRRRGHDLADISLFQLLTLIYNASVVHLSDARSKSGLGAPSNERGIDIAQGLLELKDSPDSAARTRYHQIQRAFTSLTQLSFDAVQEPRPEFSPEGTLVPGRSRLVASVVVSEGDFSYPADFAAAGMCEILQVLCAACGPTSSVLLLDEPALNLHPNKQRELYSALVTDARANSNQIFIVTHSSSFVSPRDMTRALRLTVQEGRTRVHRLGLADAREDAQMMKDVERYPRFLDALFAKGVVLLEGYQEEAGLPPWFLKCEGGSALADRNVLFLTVAGDTAFGRFARVLDAWGIPYRIVADGKARPRLGAFGELAFTYPEDDFSVLLQEYYPEETKRAMAEFGGSGGLADPVVARMVATETPPPGPIREIWARLRPFVDSSAGSVTPSHA